MDLSQAIQSALEFYQAGNPGRAESICLEILKERSDNAEVLYFLGVIYFQSGNYDPAIKYIEKSLLFNEANADAYHILGMAFQAEGRLDSAIQCYQKAIQINPNYVEAYSNLGNAVKEKGLLDQAINYYQNAIRLNPNLSVAYRNLGVAHQEKGNLDEAIGYYQTAVRLDPDSAGTYHLLGYAFMQQNRLHEAVDSYRMSLRINPDSAAVLSNLGSALGHQGKLDEAEDCLKRAIQIGPNYLNAYETFIMMMNYDARYDARSIYSEHLKFAEKFAKPLSSVIAPHTNEKSLDRRLKIGYVSPDFKQHSVAYFIEPALNVHNRELFQILCYSNGPVQDEVTMRLQHYSDEWRNIAGTSDEQAVELIRKDGIDILVDLAGYSSNNRVLLFARKPAPVQVSWIGYPATTGLSTMDYKIVDSYTDPPGTTEQFHTEKLVRMPGSFLCYMPDRDSPAVDALPALASGHITFGSFNNLAKVSPMLIETWTKILKMIPGCRLVMKAKSLSDRSTRDYVMELFTRKNVEADRLELLSWEPSVRGHLDLYNRIDIGLDTFPYNGTTTTCEALWMGVPVITLAGNTHASRVGVCLLSNIGIPELIAETYDEYVEIAINLAADIKRLKTLRGSLRAMMASSPLTDAKRFVGNLETCFRTMWKKWCNQ